MQDPSHDKTSPSAAGAAQDGAMPPQAASAQAAPPAKARDAAVKTAPGAGGGLSSMQQVVELADGLSTIADRLHERILREIRSYDDRGVPAPVQDAMRRLLDDEMVLRQRANTLYADAAAFVIQGLDQPQSRLNALTAAAAEKIRRIGVIGEVTGLVGGLLSLAGAVAAGQPTPIVLALEKIQLHSTTLDALTPPTAAA
ncbi:hypothetical protein ABIB42_003853 [Massilia sp. UYP32]|jgi:hypothetical protein|uniref:hypothetical protein n=1 Tax=Massilia TaxID=149698 RepID=UPI000D8FAD63|nr:MULTISPECIES: hypothetical protein [Massilia]QYG02050.1 hypothetical protein KY496_00950 [Massilia sp. NP310]